MHIGSYDFKPGLWPTLVTLIILPMLLRLGVWQLDRAEEKRQLYRQQQEQIEKGILTIDKRLNVDEIIQYQPVQVTGRFLTDKIIFLDNKPYNGVHGYHVITPFKIEGREEYILINRGWVAMRVHREQLPSVETSNEKQIVTGMLKMPSSSFKLGESINENIQWPWRIQWLEIDSIEKQLKLKLLPFIVLQDKKANSKLVQDWKITVSPPEKNISYAVQWFGLATALIIIFIVVNSRRIKSEKDE
jgi:surfeit locus 1 family protein